jgi:hypothetical protein
MTTWDSASITIMTTYRELLRQRLNLSVDTLAGLDRLDVTMGSKRLPLPALEELVSAEPVRLTAGVLAPGPFTRACRALAMARLEGADVPHLAATSQTELASAATAARGVIAAAIRDITSEAFNEAGAEPGFLPHGCPQPLIA